jgi:HD superfamily phosphohydrolase
VPLETTQNPTLLTKLKDFVEKNTDQQLQEYILHVESPESIFAAKEINDALWGTIRLSPLEAAILDSPILQRLRFIRQLGVVHWVYPGAVHTRFEHTLGVLNRVQELLAALDRSIQEERIDHTINPNQASILRLCALLHDVGHGVFSHVSESALDRFDEIRTALVEFANYSRPENPKLSEIIAAYIIEAPSFKKLLEILLSKLGYPIRLTDHPEQTAEQLTRMIKNSILGHPIDDQIPLLHELISGPFDADKLDYFVRDSALAGIPKVLDISRLTQKIMVRAVPQRNLPATIAARVRGGHPTYLLFGLKWSGAAVLDELHLARVLLFAKIYRHHKVLAIEAMIESILSALGALAPVLNIIKLTQLYTDDRLLSAQVDELMRVCEIEADSLNRTEIAFAADILRRLRLRRLYVRAFVVQSPFPGDPWGEDKDQRKGLRNFVEDLENPSAARALNALFAEEIHKVSALVPEAIGANFPDQFIPFSIVISTKPRVTGGTQIDRALVFHGERIVPYKDLTVNRVAWADAYNFSFASAYVFCPREIAVACFVAIEKILRNQYDVITPPIAIQLSKQNGGAVHQLKKKLDKAGYYSGVPYDVRPLPDRLQRADVDPFIEEMTTKFAAVDEPNVSSIGRRPTEFPERLRAWLNQFRDDDHVTCAMQIARNIRVLRREDTKAAILSFLNLHPEFQGATVCLLGSQKDSSAVQSYFALDAAGAFVGPMTVEQAAAKKSDKPVIFLDDIVGSGGQAKNMLGHWFDIEGLKNINLDEQRDLFGEVERAYLRERRIGFIFVAGWDEGVTALATCCKEAGLQATIYAHIPEKEIPFAFDQTLQGMSAEATQSFRAKCLAIGQNLLRSHGKSEELASQRALGYGNRAMLLVSSYNVPTQVLTCLWETGEYDGVKWQPLLRRRKKN